MLSLEALMAHDTAYGADDRLADDLALVGRLYTELGQHGIEPGDVIQLPDCAYPFAVIDSDGYAIIHLDHSSVLYKLHELKRRADNGEPF